MTLRSVHADFAWVVVIANAIVGLWAVGAHYDARVRHRLLWPATILAEATVMVQVGLGSALVAIQHHEVASFHALYGFAAFASVGILYSYRQQLKEHLFLLYGLGGLWLMGLAIRGLTISPFPKPGGR
jgi:hypothetical protein